MDILKSPKHNPDGLVTMLRQWLARKLDVGPDPGSFWCIGCTLQGGVTLIQYGKDLNVIKEHLAFHPPNDHVHIRTAITPIVEADQWRQVG